FQLVRLAELEHLLTGGAEEGAELAPLELAAALVPRLEDLFNLGVAEELLEKDVGFQRLELRLAQEGLGVFLGVVEVEELAGQLLVVRADGRPVVLVELPRKAEEGEVQRRAGRAGLGRSSRAFRRHGPRSLPTTPTAGR